MCIAPSHHHFHHHAAPCLDRPSKKTNAFDFVNDVNKYVRINYFARCLTTLNKFTFPSFFNIFVLFLFFLFLLHYFFIQNILQWIPFLSDMDGPLDVEDSRFLHTLRDKLSEFYAQALERQWVICVPVPISLQHIPVTLSLMSKFYPSFHWDNHRGERQAPTLAPYPTHPFPASLSFSLSHSHQMMQTQNVFM
jgi:hypothetical protein